MNNQKISGIMYMAAGLVFLFSSYAGGNLLLLFVAVFLIVRGFKKLVSR